METFTPRWMSQLSNYDNPVTLQRQSGLKKQAADVEIEHFYDTGKFEVACGGNTPVNSDILDEEIKKAESALSSITMKPMNLKKDQRVM